jgi:hypothetical protein
MLWANVINEVALGYDEGNSEKAFRIDTYIMRRLKGAIIIIA